MNLEIPGELITNNSNEIKYELIAGKTIIGLCGYSKSGKDTIGKMLVERLSFNRISFADVLKKDLNEFMKHSIFNDLQEKGLNINVEDIDFINPKSNQIKEILRPYMIWYGEEMKKINGIHHWTNLAFSQINPKDKKIVITDVRRPNELEIFRNSRTFKEKCYNNRREINMSMDSPYDNDKYDLDFETLLFYVNQLHNVDTDELTIETITMAMSEWLFDDIIEIDSRIQGEEHKRLHVINHVNKLVKKYPQYLI